MNGETIAIWGGRAMKESRVVGGRDLTLLQPYFPSWPYPPNSNCVTVHLKYTEVMVYYIHMIIVASTSAWAGLEEEAPVDEVEAVRTVSGEPPGYVTTLRRWRTNPSGNGWNKTLSVM